MSVIISADNLSTYLEQVENPDKVIVVGGCFDIIHAGHIDFLTAAKNLGGTLVVLVESDETVRKLKGEQRPVTSQVDRAKVLAHFKSVDVVITLPPHMADSDYAELVKKLKPDIIAVTQNDPLHDIKKSHAESVGAKVQVVIDRQKDYSTQDIINKIKNKTQDSV